MKREEIQQHLEESWPDIDFLLIDGMDEAFVGVVSGMMQTPVACYDRGKCIDLLVAQGMSEEEASEHFSFNIEGAWMGEETPVFIDFAKQEIYGS